MCSVVGVADEDTFCRACWTMVETAGRVGKKDRGYTERAEAKWDVSSETGLAIGLVSQELLVLTL